MPSLQDIIKDTVCNGITAIADFGQLTVIWSAEYWRWTTVNAIGREDHIDKVGYAPPLPDYNSQFVKILQNSGDFFDAFYFSTITYVALTALSLGKLPVKARYAISFAVAAAGVIIGETEIGHELVRNYIGLNLDTSLGTPTAGDIPMGIFGALAFIGTHQISRYHSHVARQYMDKKELDMPQNN